MREEPRPSLLGHPVCFFPLAVLWMELVYRAFCVDGFWSRGLLFLTLFSLPVGLICGLLCCFWSQTFNRVAARLLMALLTAWFLLQAVYHTIFRTVFSLSLVSMASEALGFYWRDALRGAWRGLPLILLLLVPMVLLCIYLHRDPDALEDQAGWPLLLGCTGWAMAFQLLGGGLTYQLPSNGMQSIREIYRESFDPSVIAANFGLTATLRLDITQMLFGLEQPRQTQPSPAPVTDPEPDAEPDQEPVKPYNILDIDFDKLMSEETDELLLEMHAFFRDREPTKTNAYTGMFAGKNLIFLTGEGFWRYAVHETYTPTLYKLSHEGFVFENFYNPLWWKSTTDGEYAACTSLIPSGAVRSFKTSGGNSMPFCLGNQMKKLGYPTTAWHNHTWDYYNRDVSHPNMGYEYSGLGHGLEVKPSWPESDLEMMEVVVPQLLAGEQPFHAYFMTVSGHMNYNFRDNAMSGKHYDDVADLDMSTEAKAYIACNMELDLALQYLLEELEKAGELENTVICLSGDHYPYGMDPATWTELAGQELDPNFEIYHSTLILWSGDMKEPVVVDKPCESLDILPTLSNLFGLEYDSRLLMGQDILSDAPGLVIFSNKSFLTELGRYNSKTDKFTPNEGVEVPEGYVSEVYREVKDLFRHSVNILEQDYYGKLGF